jgi:hypothetical protein
MDRFATPFSNNGVLPIPRFPRESGGPGNAADAHFSGVCATPGPWVPAFAGKANLWIGRYGRSK